VAQLYCGGILTRLHTWFAVYCEKHTEHTDTVRTSQETHYVSATEPNRLMLFGETVAVYCETIRNTQIHVVPHRKHITSPQQRTVSDVWGNSRCLLRETYGKHI
jgi:hypothetical protein